MIGIGLNAEGSGVPPDLAEEVAQLSSLDDEHLWRVARMIVPAEKSERMQELTWKQQEGLTEAEQQETKQLLRLANRVMLLRAEAAVLLQERGFDISSIVSQGWQES